MSNDSENKFTLPLIGGCLIAMIVFAVCWGREQTDLMHDTVYVIGFCASAALFAVCAIATQVKKDDPNFDKFRYLTLIFAACFCIWCGAWKADRAAKISDGIEYKYKNDSTLVK